MRLIDADALKKAIEKAFEKADLSEYEACVCVCDIYDEQIDNAPTVSDRYDEGFRDGYAKCFNDREERKENSRLFQKGGAK